MSLDQICKQEQWLETALGAPHDSANLPLKLRSCRTNAVVVLNGAIFADEM